MVLNRLSDNEIRDIVAKSTTAYNKRLNVVVGERSPSKLAAITNAKPRSGGGKPAAKVELPRETYDRLREGARRKLEVSGFGWLGSIDDVIRSIAPLQTGFLDEISSQLIEEMPDDETPQNLTQWGLNALSSGLYANARMAESAGYAVANNLSPAEAVGQVAGGAVRGVAEGLGMRFNGERPRTMGQNLESIGVNDQIRQGVADAGGDEGAGNFWVGTAGLAADFFSDPFTYVAGTGLVRAGGAAARAAGQAARQGVRNPVRLAGAAVRAGAQGRRDAIRELSANRASTKAGRAQRKLGGISVREYETENAVAAAAVAAREAQDAAAAAAAAVAREAQVPRGVPEQATPSVQSVLDEVTPAQAAPAPVSAAPDPQAFDASVQGMKTLPSQAVDPAQVLKQAYQGVIERGFDSTALTRLSQSLRASKSAPSAVPASKAEMQREVQLQVEGAAAKSPEQAPNAGRIADDVNAVIAELRRSPEGRRLLQTQVGMMSANSFSQASFEAVLRSAAYDAKPRAQIADIIDQAAGLTGSTLDRATATRITPEGLGETLVASLGARRAKKFDTQKLADELGRLETDEQRMQVLAKVLTVPGQRVKTFDQAMKAALKSQLGASEMRQLLKTLKVRSEATTAKGLQAALAGRGLKKWQQIKSETPTEAEVLFDHGVTDDVAQAADDVDVDAMRANAASTEAELSAEVFDGDPDAARLLFTATDEELVAAEKLVGAPVGDEVLPDSTITRGAVAAMVKATRQKYPDSPADAKYVERFDQEEWLVGHRAALKVARNSANRQGLAGMARADFLYDRVLDAHRVYTSRMLAAGRVPRLQHQFDEDFIEPPLYASVDQLLDLLPEDVAKRALFDLNYRVSARGEGATEAAQKAFERGITVYPTTLARAAVGAIRGKNADEIFESMNKPGRRAGNDFEKSPEGQLVMRQVADHYARPEVAAQLKLLHDAQELAAVAIAKRAVNTIVNDLARNIVRAVVRRSSVGSDRSLVSAEIEAAILAAAKLADDGARSLIRDMAQGRLQNGVLAMLGEPGVMLARADARLAAARDAVYGKNPQSGQKRSAEALKQEADMRAAAGREQTKVIEEFDDLAQEAAERRIRAGEYEDTDIGRIEALNDVWADQGYFQVFGRANVALRGSGGMPDLKDMQVSATSGLYNSTEMFAGAVNKWFTGGRIGDTLGVGGVQVKSLKSRIADDTGASGALSDAQANEFMKGWWNALARHEEALEKAGVAVSDDALRASLARGQSRNELTGTLEVAPLSPAQIDMAMELRDLIRQVFDGPLSRTPVLARDLGYQMEKLGFKDGGDFAGAERFKTDLPLSAQTNVWRDYDMTAVGHPLDALLRIHGAMTRALAPVNMARSLTAWSGHKFTEAGRSIADLKAEGWKRLNTNQEGSFLSRYLDPDMYYPPEVHEQLPYLERFLKDMDKAEILEVGSKIMRRLVRPYDLATGVLKSLQTIWNVAHHFTNVLGENFALLMAGVDPSWVVGSPAVIRAGGKLLDADMTPIDLYRQQMAPLGATAARGVDAKRARMASGESRVALEDGRNVDLSPEDVYKLAFNNGVAVTARHSKDLIPGLSDEAAGFATSRWARFTSSKLNVAARADRRLGEFSAVRDNLTRIAHFRAALESRKFRTVDEAVAYAAKQVHSYHPTIQTMSSFEQKVARRVVMYYTWVRQMAGRVILTAIEKPALVTLPSKIMYNQAEAAGLEPESIGKPIPDDPRMASYYKRGVLGPSWFGGYGPFSSPDQIPIDPETGEPIADPQLWGISLNSPQADALFTLFGGVNADDYDQTDALGHYAGMLNVFLKMPGELMFDSKAGGIGTPPSKDRFDYFMSQTGAPYRIAGALGLRPSKFEGEEAEGDRARLGLNYWTGLKFTNYTNSTAAAVAKREQGENERRYLEEELGITDEAEIKEIRKRWKKAREQDED